MSQEQAFAYAILPRTAVVLRLGLRPYSIGHELILLSRRNPFVCLPPEEIAKLGDVEFRKALMEATLICARTWSENRESHWPKGWNRKVRGADFVHEANTLIRYRLEGWTGPRINDLPGGPEKGRAFGSPLMALLLSFAAGLSKRGIGPDCPYDCPLALALWLWCAEREVTGACEVANAQELENMDERDRLRAEIRAEQAAEAKKEEEAKKEGATLTPQAAQATVHDWGGLCPP